MYPWLAPVISGAEGFGNLFLSLSMIAAGSAMVSTRTLSVGAGWIGVLAGLVTIVRIYAVGTPLAGLVFVAFFPSLILAVVFRLWTGNALRNEPAPATDVPQATGAVPAAL